MLDCLGDILIIYISFLIFIILQSNEMRLIFFSKDRTNYFVFFVLGFFEDHDDGTVVACFIYNIHYI